MGAPSRKKVHYDMNNRIVLQQIHDGDICDGQATTITMRVPPEDLHRVMQVPRDLWEETTLKMTAVMMA